MESLNEEEILKELKEWLKYDTNFTNLPEFESKNLYKLIQGLLDLYNKEKACNEELRKICYGKALEDLETSHIYKQEQNTDLTTTYMNGVYDGEDKWKNKIKKALEELEKMTMINAFNYPIYRYTKNILEDLLKQ